MKIKDLTLGQFHHICSSNHCETCPLYGTKIKGLPSNIQSCMVRGTPLYFEEEYWNYEIRGLDDAPDNRNM